MTRGRTRLAAMLAAGALTTLMGASGNGTFPYRRREHAGFRYIGRH
jgi:hypothetical protein